MAACDFSEAQSLEVWFHQIDIGNIPEENLTPAPIMSRKIIGSVSRVCFNETTGGESGMLKAEAIRPRWIRRRPQTTGTWGRYTALSSSWAAGLVWDRCLSQKSSNSESHYISSALKVTNYFPLSSNQSGSIPKKNNKNKKHHASPIPLSPKHWNISI